MKRSSIVAAALVIMALLSATSAASAQAQAGPEPRAIEVPLFELTSVVPAGWQDISPGVYARGEPPADLAVLAVQSALATPDDLWSALLPQLGLDEIPEPTGTFSSASFEWTLFAPDVSRPTMELGVEVALAEAEGRTYLVLLQADAAEFEALREQAFVAALEATAPLAPELSPDPAMLGYEVEEVMFPGGSPGVELAGTLTLPSAPGPHPVVVLMSGSGAQDRDESLKPVSTLKPFALIADALTSAGVGVLRYDDRGVGGSSGDYNAATVQELASDGRAAIDFLETRDDVDPERIGLLGHSEGGMYAAMLGASDPRIAFIVAMAPAVVDGVDLLIAQNEALVRADGGSGQEASAAGAFAAEVMPAARDGDRAGVKAAMRSYYRDVWDGLSPDEQALAGEREDFVKRQLDMQLDVYLSDWFRSLLAYDAEPDWARISVPVLGLFGARDAQVVLEQNEPALRAALEAAGSEDFETVIFPDANHLFQASETGAYGEYSSLAPAFTPDFLPTLVEWVAARAGVER